MTRPSILELCGCPTPCLAGTIVGFGQAGLVNPTGTGYVAGGTTGTRHAGLNTIKSKSLTDRGPGLIAMLDAAGKAALTGGDSGGGWFVGGKLVGISDFTFSTSLTKPLYGFAHSPYFGSGAVDLTHPAIRSWISGASSRSLKPVPEPGSLVALAMAISALCLKRRL